MWEGVRTYHATDVVAYDVESGSQVGVAVLVARDHAQMLEEVEHVARHGCLGEGICGWRWFRGIARAAVVGREDVVARAGERGEDVPVLVGGLGEAVEEQNGVLVCRWWNVIV